ncbi:hypothetical protein lerEdw1_009498 [Lerista edwardsae]|nr:hypothetical protein lerEdw1_009498 [Lerista edwardsae]
MGNTLGCVKEPKEQAGEAGNAPFSPKRKARFKRKKKGKKRTVPEGGDSVAEEPPRGVEAAGEAEEKVLKKFGAAPLQEEGEDLVESLHQSAASQCPALEPAAHDQGHVVQVRERFQGRLEKAHLVTDKASLQPRVARDPPEEGTTVIARLLDNPAEQNREKVAGQPGASQRPGTGNRRAVLVPLRKELFTGGSNEDDQGMVVVCRSWDQPKLETPATVWEESQGAWNSEEGSDSLLSSTRGASWTVEKGTVSELSTPSPMTDQMETQVAERPQQPLYSQESLVGRGGEGAWAKLPASQSKSSFSGSISSTVRCSSGYGSDPAHQQAKASTTGSNTVSLCDDSLSAASVGAEGPRWRAAAKEKGKLAEGGVSAGFFSPWLLGLGPGDLRLLRRQLWADELRSLI